MKWFKHMAHANADDKIVSIRAEFGMWGVGCYWTLVELAAEQMEKHNERPRAVLTVAELCSLFGCKRNKLETFLKHLQNVRGMNHEFTGNVVAIEVPKLLEIKDNYHKDLEATEKTLPSKEVEAEAEEEVEEEKEKEYSTPAKFEIVWSRYPNRQGKKHALRHFLASVKTHTDFENIQKALANYCSSGNFKRGFVKHGSTWFNEWQDWLDPTEIMMKGNGGDSRKYKYDPDKYREVEGTGTSDVGSVHGGHQDARGSQARKLLP